VGQVLEQVQAVFKGKPLHPVQQTQVFPATAALLLGGGQFVAGIAHRAFDVDGHAEKSSRFGIDCHSRTFF